MVQVRVRPVLLLQWLSTVMSPLFCSSSPLWFLFCRCSHCSTSPSSGGWSWTTICPSKFWRSVRVILWVQLIAHKLWCFWAPELLAQVSPWVCVNRTRGTLPSCRSCAACLPSWWVLPAGLWILQLPWSYWGMRSGPVRPSRCHLDRSVLNLCLRATGTKCGPESHKIKPNRY